MNFRKLLAAVAALLCTGVALAQVCVEPNLPFGANPVSNSSTIHLAGLTEPVDDLEIELEIAHTWVTDVVVTLAHGGVTRLLIDRPGIPSLGGCGCSHDDIDVTLSDAATSPAENACNATAPAISGTLSPTQTLSAFDWSDPNGAWTLTVIDEFPSADDGTLERWCVHLNELGGTGGTGGTPTPATSEWGVVALIALFLGGSLFFLGRQRSTEN